MPNLNNITNPTEDQECEAFAQWLRLKKIPFTHISNESGRGRTSMLRTAKMKRLGQSAGFPDYLVRVKNDVGPDGDGGYWDYFGKENGGGFKYRVVAIEMKRRKGGRLTPEQKAWLEILNNAGIGAVVCNGFDEARKFIEERL